MKFIAAAFVSAALLVSAVPTVLAHCGGCGVDCATECTKKGVKDQSSCMEKCKKDHPKDTSKLPQKAKK